MLGKQKLCGAPKSQMRLQPFDHAASVALFPLGIPDERQVIRSKSSQARDSRVQLNATACNSAQQPSSYFESPEFPLRWACITYMSAAFWDVHSD
jgi:hypothetical protein